MKNKQESLKTFHWHNLAQFGGALNDNLFKLAVIYTMVFAWPDKDKNEVNAIVGAVFAIPFLLFLGAAGILADRIRKHRIVQGIKLMEIGVMAFGAAAIYFQNRWMLLGGMFLMSVQSALFSPAKFGIVPELVGRKNISRANSLMQAATYLAMIFGTALAPLFSRLLGRGTGITCVVIAFLGWLASTRIAPTPKAGGTAKANVFFFRDIFKSIKVIHQDAFLALAVWSSAFFLMIAAFVQLNILSYGPSHLGMANQEEATLLFLVVAFGIGIGSLIAGKVSRHSIEFGIIPIGSGFLALSCVGLWAIPEGAKIAAYGFCLIMGMGAGLFVVPVQSFLQFRSPPEKMGEIIAAAGWLSWVGVLLAAGLLHLCAATLELSAATNFLVIGSLVLTMAVVSFLVLPDFFVRFVVMLLTRCFYRLRASGIRNLPAQGGALIVANHVSLMDAIWICAVQQRRVRFLMSRSYLAACSPWMRGLLKLGGVIAIHEDDSPKALLTSLKEARRVIEEGFIVAIFPEGHLSRTGHMMPFKPGFERIVKDTGAPILPLYIEGGFGTRASLAFGEPCLMHRDDFRTQVTIAIGEPLPSTASTEEVFQAVQVLAATATDAYAPIRGSAGRCFARTARTHWKKKAIADSSGKTLTYGNALIASLLIRDRLAQQLAGNPEEIGVLLPPSAGGALVNLALAMEGRVAVNLNYTSSKNAQTSAMEQAGIRTLITSRKFMEKFPDTPTPEQVLYAEDLAANFSTPAKIWTLLKARLAPLPMLVSDRLWAPEDPLTILFSSGSTANPKGILLSHHNILSNIDGFRVVARAQENDVICSVLPFFHSFGFTAGLWFPLTNGLGVAYHHHPLETDAISDIAEKNRCSIHMGTTTYLMAWVRKIRPEAFAHLRWVVVGAEKLRPKLADMFEKRYGVRPLEGYGATECSPVIAVNVPDVEFEGLTQIGNKEGSVGRPLPNVRTKILDPDTEKAVPRGEAGLLWVKGPSIMQGYVKNPEKTKEALIDGWYNTGDIVQMDVNGFITITDRLTRFSKLAGEMVSHSAVEEALQDALGCTPDQLAVTGISDEKKGERLMVVFMKTLGDPEGFQDKVRALSIPNLWKPDSRAWVPVDELPTLGTGKLDLKRLKELVTAS
ncbi:MAG: MFS transporter [Kiritimatiellae bacterium]|jgi:acyl-[acyl-carrier-protein]-phospholipid O-acyltransferase/long-chain-fatty-acid--[acyl-carrier-protein] ligase|nr:MFS transporter [Kiritimatiellia bacterium]